MASDYIYYYTKDTFEQKLLGEIQSNFNMSRVIDGTKDSMKVQVLNFSGEEIEPLTILEHKATNTWWVVSHDKVERDMSEIGFRYTHNLQVLGAIELLNARDLTDSGFNQNTYTIREFIFRLCRLSNWEFANDDRLSYELLSNELDVDMNIDYMKTFENYTLLSALREFLEGYNCDVKLGFDTNIDQEIWGDNNYHLTTASIYIIPKTGYSNKTPYDESEFMDIRETKTMDKNSFGTTVVSNAENVISSKSKRFPTTGAVRVSGTEYEINANNAIIRLPSNVFKVNLIKVYFPITLRYEIRGSTYTYTINPQDKFSIKRLIDKLCDDTYNKLSVVSGSVAFVDYNKIKNYFNDNIDTILEPAIKGSSCTLYSGWSFNPVSSQVENTSDNPDFYFTVIYRHFLEGNVGSNFEWLVGEKQQHDNITQPSRCLYYEKGKNYITDFGILAPIGGEVNPFGDYSYIASYLYTDLRDGTYDPILINTDYNYHIYYDQFADFGTTSQFANVEVQFSLGRLPYINVGNTTYVVDYIPMSDLKIKYDNSGERNDTQLYNQNGKLNDSVALSKLLLSYSKEIESDTITKYAHYYNYNNIPNVGDMVSIGNNIYVINNISYDFYENEESDNSAYYIECEFTMSKKVGTKSLLTNPNSNIRDYGIPQNNNVVRKQLYRDFYELGHTLDNNADNDYYLPLDKIMNVSNRYQDYQEHIAVIKLGYEEQVQGHSNWYYQLDTTTYILKKAIYEVVNFNDNNIIGYSSQNVLSEFDISRVFSGIIDTKNTPISYTDNNGKVASVEIAYCSNEQLTQIYDNYRLAQSGGSSYSGTLYNYSVFIPEEIYEGADYGTSYAYVGVIQEFGTSGAVQRINVTNYLNGFNGDANDLSVEKLQVYDFNGTIQIEDTDYTYYFTKTGGAYFLVVDIYPSSTAYSYADIVITNILRVGFAGAKHINDFKIEEPYYLKDALEVPFFEYSCQIDNSDDVIIGDNILDTKSDTYVYMYSYVLVPKNQVNENNFFRYVEKPIGTFDDYNHFIVNVAKGIKMTYNNDKLEINFYDNESYDVISDTFAQGTIAPIAGQFESQLKTHDLMIVRHKVNEHTTYTTIDSTMYVDSIDDLMFVIRNTNNAQLDSFNLYLEINHYKIK